MFQSKLIILFVLSIEVFVSCQSDNNRRQDDANYNKNKLNKGCITQLIHFSDTLNLNCQNILNPYFDEKHFSLKGCDLKMFRHNLNMEIAIVLVILKIENYNLKKGDLNGSALSLGDLSNTAGKIAQEYIYLLNGKDIYVESLPTADVKYLIQKHAVLLKTKSINALYQENTKLRKSLIHKSLYKSL